MTDVAEDRVLEGQRAIWRLEPAIPAQIREALPGWSPMLSHLLYCRGYRTAAAIEAFFTQGTISHDPFLLPDMAAAVGRIRQAIARRENVAIYGDFDCDGLTATAVLVFTLRGCGLEPIVHLPHRADGHGLHPEALAALADAGVQLIITADCGVSAIEEVQVALGMGMEVVITDHHEARADGSLPDCPTVDPTRHDSEYPWRFLCGAGVAYKLAQALHRREPRAPDPDELLDLVALGTVADVVPIRDENRSLVIRGLQRLQTTERPGLLALFQAAGVDRRRIDPVSIGFYLAPRLNAANRMDTPQLAYDCLIATDDATAMDKAQQLSDFNGDRQVLVAATTAALMEEIGRPADITAAVQSGTHPPLLIRLGSWPAGISGLLASKLVDAYALPAFVGTDADGEVIAVSARGIPGVRLDEILESCEAALPEGLFLGYGGHARAGGFRVSRERLEPALQLITEYTTRQVPIAEVGAILTVDAEVPLHRLTLEAAKQIRTLAPFGAGFEEPLFLSRGLNLLRRTPVGGEKHARVRLQQGDVVLGAIHFHADPSFFQLPLPSTIDAVFHLQINEWDGWLKPELRLRDWRVSS